ncbi:MAG: phosphohydrolase [Desulfuromonas sp.]|nr:MAG: phosphohydrolase [Desulfuromonas sp.]
MSFDGHRLKQQIAFIERLDHLKQVLRQNLVMDESRRENSAEHSWHIASMALVLAEYAPQQVDQQQVLKLLLLHDVIEIEAGDTFCFDLEGNRDKLERERRAAEQVFGLLPEDLAVEFRALWDEFEAGESAEARFANALDRFQVLLQNFNTRGGTWRIHGIEKARVVQRMLPIRDGAPALWPVVESYLEAACASGILTE